MARLENERSCIVCVKGCQIFSLFLRLFRWILELFRQYGCFFFALYVKTRIHSIRSDYDTFYDERKRKSYICVFEQCWVLGPLSKDVSTLQLTALMCLSLSLNESLISNTT